MRGPTCNDLIMPIRLAVAVIILLAGHSDIRVVELKPESDK